jgi:hypothetical protein
MLCGWTKPPESDDDRSAYVRARKAVAETSGITVYDASQDRTSATVESVCAWVRGLDPTPHVVFIDYAQKMRTRDKKPRRSDELAEYCSSELALLARELRIAVVIGSQITIGSDGVDISKGGRAWEEDAGLILRIRKITNEQKVKLTDTSLHSVKRLTLATVQKNRYGADAASRYWEHLGGYVKFAELGTIK